MCILTLDQRAWIITLRIPLTMIVVSIHRAEDVRLAPVTSLLILYRTRGVILLNPFIALLEVRTIAGLITHGPYNDGRMVLKRSHVSLITFQMHLLEVLTLGQCLITITHTMTLKVCFCSHIDTILVAKVIPTGIVRIVTGTNSIDIQLFHNLDILNHALHRYHIAAIWVELVTVGTLYQNSLTIYQQLSIFDFDMTEAYTLSYHFQHVITFLQGDKEIIELRRLCRPRLNLCQIYLLTIVVSQQLFRTCAFRGLYVNLQYTSSVHIVLMHEDILNMLLGTCTEINLTGNTSKAPEVLVLQIRTVTPAHHLHGYQVLTLLQIFGNIEFSSHFRIL